jgi:hypothetical protein
MSEGLSSVSTPRLDTCRWFQNGSPAVRVNIPVDVWPPRAIRSISLISVRRGRAIELSTDFLRLSLTARFYRAFSAPTLLLRLRADDGKTSCLSERPDAVNPARHCVDDFGCLGGHRRIVAQPETDHAA